MIVFVSHPKSGTHLLRALLEQAGHEVGHRHYVEMALRKWGRVDLHLIRHPYDVAVSAAAFWILQRPEVDPRALAEVVPEAIRGLGRGDWMHYASWATTNAAAHATGARLVRFEDLVADPVEALAPLEVRPLERPPTWDRDAFRAGRVGGWREVVEARGELAEMFEAELGADARAWGYET